VVVPILRRSRKLLQPFEHACKWCSIDEEGIKRSSEFSEGPPSKDNSAVPRKDEQKHNSERKQDSKGSHANILAKDSSSNIVSGGSSPSSTIRKGPSGVSSIELGHAMTNNPMRVNTPTSATAATSPVLLRHAHIQ
jgi:hypothetical protein